MIDLIIFNIQDSYYAVDIENIQRIVQSGELTKVPNAHPLIDGMMSFEDQIIKIVNFRKMLNFQTYDEELNDKFIELKGQHKSWVEALKQTAHTGAEFHKTSNPHMCELGKWLDSFTSYDDHVSAILKELNRHHKQLHQSANEVVHLGEESLEESIKYFEKDVMKIYEHTMGAIDTFIAEFDIVAASLQKLLLYHGDTGSFAIKVDSIVDIAHIEDEEIKKSNEGSARNEFLELSGVLEFDNKLINVINSIKIPH